MSIELSVVDTARYLVKSMAAEVGPIEVARDGIKGDRGYVVVDLKGEMITQRKKAQMASMIPRLEEESLSISTPDGARLVVPRITDGKRLRVVVWGNELIGTDQGDHAAEWLSHVLKVSCRLVLKTTDEQRAKRVDNQTFPFAYADSYPATVGYVRSFEDLLSKLRQGGITNITLDGLIRRMRSNVVIGDLDGVPYDDDTWSVIQFENGVTIKFVKVCLRCPIPQIDQGTGAKGSEPNRTLHRYRAVLDEDGNRNVAFCQKAVITGGQIYPGLKVVQVTKGRKSPSFIRS